MAIVREPFSYDRNLNEVRMFLLNIYKETGALHYLIPTKIENQKFGPCGPDYSPKDDDAIKIWRISKSDDSEIIAVSHRGSAGNYHIEIHPDYKHMEKELFQEIENLERTIVGEEKSRMYMYTVSSDSSRPQILTERDYEDYGLHEYNYEFPLNVSIPNNRLPEGYSIRSVSNEQDYLKYIEVIGSVYDHCRQHMTIEKMRFMTQAEFYHQDLTLAAVDDSGRFVGFCMFRLDPLTNIAEMELLDVHPDFRNQGLEEAMLSEGLQRVMKYRPILLCVVEVDVSEPLNEKLESAGFIRSVKMNMWGKMI
ncbi:MAG: GNAT family N-acetyltransferase [Candidatus Thorarchaeota archaeon]|nr:GNAT family N-acetyltransferase [Candidatus Thorarchaeota archaeon]